jgi:hypothetical protein
MLNFFNCQCDLPAWDLMLSWCKDIGIAFLLVAVHTLVAAIQGILKTIASETWFLCQSFLQLDRMGD